MDLYDVELGRGLYWSGSEYGQVTSSFELGNELFWFHKMWGNSWLADDVLASKEVLFCIELVKYRRIIILLYVGWNFNSGNCEYLFTTDTK